MDKVLLRVGEVCELTGLGRSTIYQLMGQPDGLPVVRIGRAVRIPAIEVRKWVARQYQSEAVQEPATAL